MTVRFKHIAVALVLTFVALGDIAQGKAYLSKDQALELAFPEAEEIKTANIYLTDEEMREVTRASGAKVDSALYTFYVAKKQEKVLGYAAIEAATVRTLPETVMVVMNPDATVEFVEILAFFEPEEYKPSKRWLDQFRQERLDSDLRVGGRIQGLTGATLSAQAITRQVRKSSAMLRIFLQQQS